MAMTLRLTDEETEGLRRRAELEHRSMQEVARQAVREYIESHSRADLLDLVLDQELPRYAHEAPRTVIYLTLAELLHVAERAVGHGLAVRDHGLLEAALARPRTTVAGADAYPTLDHKAAALLHSLARNHALVDGNKRLALAGLIASYGMNGRRLAISNDDAYELVMRVAVGDLDEITDISHLLVASTGPWPDPGTIHDRGLGKRPA
jgi:death on curing protein